MTLNYNSKHYMNGNKGTVNIRQAKHPLSKVNKFEHVQGVPIWVGLNVGRGQGWHTAYG